MTRRLAVAVFVLAWGLTAALPSQGAWLATATGLGLSRSSTVGPGSTPAASVTGRTVTLTWTGTTLATGTTVTTYLVRRYDASSSTQLPIDAGTCSGTVSATTCTHTSAPAGSSRYTVTPVYGFWRGAESPSRTVTIAGPSLSLTSSTVTPGASPTGTAGGFIGGETLRYRLDSPTGTDLAGTLGGVATPTTVPVSGGGSVVVTIPVGTADGTHTVFAVSSPSGDTAVATLVVDGTAPPLPVLTRTPPNPSGDSATFEYTESEASASVECRLDAAAFAGCMSPVDYLTLAAGSHTFQVRATDTTGNVSASTSYIWTVDTNLPTIAITFPTAMGRYNDAGFNAGCSTAPGDVCGAADDLTLVASTAVSLRQLGTGLYWSGTAFSSAGEVFLTATGTIDWNYAIAASSFPGEGDYTLRARATNSAGGLGYDSRTFTLDRTAPPTPTLTSSPAASSGPSVSAGFTDADPSATFECRLDGAAYTACTSPQTYTGLADGAHSLQVRAVDGAGNTSAAVTTSWTTDASPPTVAVTFPSAGSLSSAGWTAGCATPAVGDLCGTAADVGSGLATVAVSLRRASTNRWWDGSSFAATSETFLTATGTSTWSLGFAAAGFPADGTYSVRARATDAVGNATTATVDIVLDNVAPPAPVFTLVPGDPSGESVTFRFTEAEATATLQCRLDAGAFTPCTSPKSYTGLTSGSHSLSVQALDAAGNTSPAIAYTWTVDLALPVVDATFPDPGGIYSDATYVAGCGTPGGDLCGTASVTTGSIAGVDVSIRRTGTALYWNGTSFASATEVFLPATGTTSWTYAMAATSFPAEDGYTIRARATNSAGSVAYDTFAITVDRTAPAVPVITSGPSGITGGGDTFAFSGDTDATLQCRLDAGTFAACTSPVTLGALADGPHTYSVRSVDAAGNLSAAVSRTWTVDATAPTVGTTFPVAAARYGTTSYNAGCATASVGDLCGTASDAGSGLSTVQVSVRRDSTGLYLSGTTFGAATQTWLTTTGTSSWSYALASTTFPADGSYTLVARATDAAGNTATATTVLTIDRTAPKAVGLSSTNVGATAGRLEVSDQLTRTYSEAVAPGSILAGFTGASVNVVVRASNSSTADKLTVYNATNTTLLPLGTVNLRRGDFVTSAITFGATGTPSTMTIVGSSVVITLGTPSNALAVTTALGAGNMTWTPSATVTDLAGNAALTTAYAETDNDLDF